METTKRRSDAFPYQVFPFLETQTMPGGSKFNAKKGSILLDNLHTLDLSPTGLKFLPSEMKALERISKRHGWLDRFDITPTKARFFYGNWSDPSEQEDYSFLLKDVLKWVDKHIPRSHIFAVLTAPVYATVQVSVG